MLMNYQRDSTVLYIVLFHVYMYCCQAAIVKPESSIKKD